MEAGKLVTGLMVSQASKGQIIANVTQRIVESNQLHLALDLSLHCYLFSIVFLG